MRTRYEVLNDIRNCKRLLSIANEHFNQITRQISSIRKEEGFSERYFEFIETRDVVWRSKLTIERKLSVLDEELRSIYEGEHYNSRSLEILYYDDCRLNFKNGTIRGIKL